MPTFQAGDTVRGYRLLADFHVANGGNCKWTFAEKGGTEYFIKEFFSPKFPVKPMGSEKTMKAKFENCARFERQQKIVLGEARAVAGAGGRLVVPVDFFREGGTYYKVAPKVNAVALAVDEIARLPFDQQLSIMRAVTSALRALHNAQIVHGDLSPANILISQETGASYKAHVIDFDSSYLSGDAPPKEELMGNPPYYSPELLSYIQEELHEPSALTIQSDIFALGLVFWQYLFGSLPTINEPFHYASEAVRAGQSLPVPRKAVPEAVPALLEAMLHPDPAHRPTMMQVQTKVKALAKPEVKAPPPRSPDRTPVRPEPEPVPWDRSKGSRIKKKGFATREPAIPEPEPVPTTSRVKFKRRST